MADDKKAVLIDYTNHRGVRQLRRIEPINVAFENSKWHPETQWLIESHDLDKGALRTFAMASIHGWQPANTRIARVDETIARRLQASIERSNRTHVRLKKLHDHSSCPIDVARALESIMNDEEPVWHE